MKKKKTTKKMKLQMIIVLIMAIIIVGSVFLPWMMASYSSSLISEKLNVTYFGHEFLNALFNGKDSINIKDPEAGIIYSWTQGDKTKVGAYALMLAVVGSLAVGALMAFSALMGLVTKKKLFKQINKICGILLFIIGLIGIICGFTIINQVHNLDLLAVSSLASIKQIVIAPFIIAIGGIVASVVSCVVKK